METRTSCGIAENRLVLVTSQYRDPWHVLVSQVLEGIEVSDLSQCQTVQDHGRSTQS